MKINELISQGLREYGKLSSRVFDSMESVRGTTDRDITVTSIGQSLSISQFETHLVCILPDYKEMSHYFFLTNLLRESLREKFNEIVGEVKK